MRLPHPPARGERWSSRKQVSLRLTHAVELIKSLGRKALALPRCAGVLA